MNSPNAHSEYELDRLVREALHARFSTQEPPEHVWRHIRLQLESGASSPRRRPMPWLPIAAQFAVTLLLVILAGVGLQTRLVPDDAYILPRELLPSVTTIYVGERSAPSRVMLPSNEADVGSLKVYSKLQAADQNDDDVESKGHPPGMVPLHGASYPASAGGGLSEPESSSSLLAVEQTVLVHDGRRER